MARQIKMIKQNFDYNDISTEDLISGLPTVCLEELCYLLGFGRKNYSSNEKAKNELTRVGLIDESGKQRRLENYMSGFVYQKLQERDNARGAINVRAEQDTILGRVKK